MTRFLVFLFSLFFISICQSEREDSSKSKDFEWDDEIREVSNSYTARTLFRIPPSLNLKMEPVPGCSVTTPSLEEKDEIVHTHNTLRRKIAKGLERRGYNGTSQPRAKDMMALGYSDILEKMAAMWASKCNASFDDHYITDDYKRVWQSIAHNKSSEPVPLFHLPGVAEQRYNAKVVNFYGPDALRPFYGRNSQTKKDVRSYAIMVAKGIRSIGCAQASFLSEGDKEYHRMAICNYAGEFKAGQPVYNEGEPCSDVAPYFCDNGLITIIDSEKKGT